MAATKKVKIIDRTTIKVGREAAARLRMVAFIERVAPVDLYTLAFEEWVRRYEKAAGKTLEEMQPGFAPINSPEGRLLEQIRKEVQSKA